MYADERLPLLSAVMPDSDGVVRARWRAERSLNDSAQGSGTRTDDERDARDGASVVRSHPKQMTRSTCGSQIDGMSANLAPLRLRLCREVLNPAKRRRCTGGQRIQLIFRCLSSMAQLVSLTSLALSHDHPTS